MDIKDILATLTPEQRARLEAKIAKAKIGPNEAELAAKYPHVKPGTLGFDDAAQKYHVTIACQHPGCEAERRVFTSDLFQVKLCLTHKKEAKKSEKERLKLLMAELRKAKQAEQG